MMRIRILLAVVAMLCALAIVTARQTSRELFIEAEAIKRERRDIEIAWAELQLHQRTLAAHARVERLASQKLGMESPVLDKVWLIGGAP
jgi:cell division protein FtsL